MTQETEELVRRFYEDVLGAGNLAVHPDLRVVEHGTEAQQNRPGQPFGRKLDRAPVDSDAGPHAQRGDLGLPRSGHLDVADFGGSGQPVVTHVQKFPSAFRTRCVGRIVGFEACGSALVRPNQARVAS